MEVALYGTDGKPIVGPDGVWKVRSTYDTNNHVNSYRSYSVDGKLHSTAGGFAIVRMINDAKGNNLERSFFGTDEKPVLVTPEGYFRTTALYDAHNNVLANSYFGINGKPAVINDGYASIKFVRDAAGNETEETYYGPDGKPTVANVGCFRYVQTVDALGFVTSAGCRGLDNTPTVNRYGYAFATFINIENGSRLQANFYGTDHQPTLAPGFFESRMEYDHSNRLTSVQYLNAAGKLVVATLAGVARLTTTYGPDGKPQTLAFDDKGKLISPVPAPISESNLGNLVVSGYLPGSQAQQVGIQPNDILVGYAGQPLRTVPQLISLTKSGTGIRELELVRGGKTHRIAVHPGLLGLNILDRRSQIMPVPR